MIRLKKLTSKREYRFSKFEAAYQNPRFKSYVSQIFGKTLPKKCPYSTFL